MNKNIARASTQTSNIIFLVYSITGMIFNRVLMSFFAVYKRCYHLNIPAVRSKELLFQQPICLWTTKKVMQRDCIAVSFLREAGFNPELSN